jgi:hypothetical protein
VSCCGERRRRCCNVMAMKLVVALVFVTATGCGGKKVDCEALATHVADVSTATEAVAFKTELRGKIHNATNASCSDGSYTPKQLECLGTTTSNDDVARCLGLPVTVAATPPPPPPPPPPTAKPTIADATAALTKLVSQADDGADVAMMHGCGEGADRISQLFDKLTERAAELHRMMRDDALRTELEKVVQDRSDKALAAALTKIDTAIGKCKPAAEEVTKGIARLMKP